MSWLFWLVGHWEVIKFANALDIVDFFAYRNHITPVLEYGYNSGQCPTLTKQGRKVEDSDKKTFDLKVDGKYAEVKTKNKPYSKLDFLSFTDKQYAKILEEDFLIFLVCNIDDPEKIEIYEFSSNKLRKTAPKKYTSHEFNKSVIDKISKIKYAQ